MAESFDFIIVGVGGTAGLLLAKQLAVALPEHSVLVLESGSAYPDKTHLAKYDRYHAWERPDLDLGYISTPQTLLKNQVIPYPRGKGPGGSSNTNFMNYLYGSGEDYNYWAELVGDESWKWQNTQRRFKELETFHTDIPEGMKKYANPLPENHGHDGPLHVSLPPQWENGITELFDAGARYGIPLNPDVNSGNPIGMCIAPCTYLGGYRITSESILFNNTPKNVKLVTDAKVSKVIFKDNLKIAAGVETTDGRTFTAKQEVILSAGAIDTPKILLLSGIGPSQELAEHGIQAIHDLPGVGKNLADHCLIVLGASYAPGMGLTDRFKFDSDPVAVKAAREQWKRDGTGESNLHRYCIITSWLKEKSISTTDEYKDLDSLARQHLAQDSVPNYETILAGPHFPPTYVVPEGTSFLSTGVALMNAQSRGEVTLKSSNSADDPLINFNFMSHAFDRRMMILAVREFMKFLESDAFGPEFKEYIAGPKSQSDENIYDYIQEQLMPVLHANGTVKMGKPDYPDACIDTTFRVYGVERLRVVDLSVCPMMPNNHTQSTAYVVAQTAYEKIAEEYGGNAHV
ncbi:hypothetical protein AJ79_08280 [Helicocarpus griseus UAMH5409]|uniref:Glucose-methanol-choline oxidoreductase N-terminal domain-containing protein n=1 Tax=Helicocarpus griseus UAMH5409 TaxID=1447875 RepID=A0A2B7WU11_9EURO|nr:hypothetical protein AJ79_08280 [Helicocarpus griseus UAMH5409]